MSTSEREFWTKKVMILNGESNIEDWNFDLRNHLEYEGLLKYIVEEDLEVVKKEEKETDTTFEERQKQHRMNRLQVAMIINKSLSTTVRNLLKNYGWDMNTKNNKYTYDLIMSQVPSASADRVAELIDDWHTLSTPTDLQDFLNKVTYTRVRLTQLKVDISDTYAIPLILWPYRTFTIGVVVEEEGEDTIPDTKASPRTQSLRDHHQTTPSLIPKAPATLTSGDL
ncbi:hypothetical protein F4804DRAFT_351180 [Jackrogersella minutella]|nr:hypothetical protein F4804DRAFT_351180 [Jackrogersella minutella]